MRTEATCERLPDAALQRPRGGCPPAARAALVEAVDAVIEPKFRPDIWTSKLTARFLDGIQDHRLYAAFYLMITTGASKTS